MQRSNTLINFPCVPVFGSAGFTGHSEVFFCEEMWKLDTLVASREDLARLLPEQWPCGPRRILGICPPFFVVVFFVLISWKRARSVILRGYVSGAGVMSEGSPSDAPAALSPRLQRGWDTRCFKRDYFVTRLSLFHSFSLSFFSVVF